MIHAMMPPGSRSMSPPAVPSGPGWRLPLNHPFFRPRLPPELLRNRFHHEVHEGDVVRYAVQLEAAVKLLRNAGRQLRPGFLGLRHLCGLRFRARWTTPTANGLPFG